MTKKAVKEAKDVKEEKSVKKPNTYKRYANLTFTEDDKGVHTKLSTLGFDKEPGRLVSYLCMGVALIGQAYKVPVKEMNKQVTDYYDKFAESRSNNEEEEK